MKRKQNKRKINEEDTRRRKRKVEKYLSFFLLFFFSSFLIFFRKGVSFEKRIEQNKHNQSRETISDFGGSLQMTYVPKEEKVREKKNNEGKNKKNQK